MRGVIGIWSRGWTKILIFDVQIWTLFCLFLYLSQFMLWSLIENCLKLGMQSISPTVCDSDQLNMSRYKHLFTISRIKYQVVLINYIQPDNSSVSPDWVLNWSHTDILCRHAVLFREHTCHVLTALLEQVLDVAVRLKDTSAAYLLPLVHSYTHYHRI